MERHEVVIIGGGAAGMVAAGRCAELGAEVCLLEKNGQLGRKIGITGKGRCNLTTSLPSVMEIVEQFPGSGKFLFSALTAFSNLDTITFFHGFGLETVTERGNRVFPASQSALDVAKALRRYVGKSGCKTILGCTVRGISSEEDGFLVEAGDRRFRAQQLIVATGGASYPGTGSTGDGYAWAQALGHNIVPLKPALVPLETRESWVREVQGLALKNVTASLFREGREIGSEFGEMLFTHFGVSGPIILTLSRLVSQGKPGGTGMELKIDLKPALTVEKVHLRLQRDFEKYSRRRIRNALGDLLPQGLIPVIIGLAGIDEDRPVNQLTREDRNGLVQLLKGLPVSIAGTRPLAEAIVTAGGVSTREIDPRTMASKIVPGLYFAGEIIDVDGNTGGFNLQAAFSTGYLAGSSAARRLEENG